MDTKKLCEEVKEVIQESAQHRMDMADVLLADITLEAMMFDMELKMDQIIAKKMEHQMDDENVKKQYRRYLLF